ncbi:hypothetical protein EUGRSUZ_F01521 [Eucalyptus grandis]|uniref:Uncharacterized protein n=2 Tax=Eucalyptus grandis TaxID=71139 RepID=A0ACC3KEJ8_EUCGR|nr:hypothetical protein EUGRSUZ_F01521 [Eucalyptus grandis]
MQPSLNRLLINQILHVRFIHLAFFLSFIFSPNTRFTEYLASLGFHSVQLTCFLLVQNPWWNFFIYQVIFMSWVVRSGDGHCLCLCSSFDH